MMDVFSFNGTSLINTFLAGSCKKYLICIYSIYSFCMCAVWPTCLIWFLCHGCNISPLEHALVVGLFQMAGADRLTGAGAGAGALLHLLPVPRLLFVLWLLSPLFHLLHMPDLSDLLARRRPDFPPPLSHQSLGGHAQVLGRGHALSLDPLDVVDSVGPILELVWILASACFISRILPGWIRRRFVRLQLALVTHGRGTTDDEDHDDEKGGHDDDDEQILLQEVHYSGQDEVLQADHGGGDGVGEGGSSSSSGDVSRCSSGEGGWEKELQLCLIAAAVHGYVVEHRSGVTNTAAQWEQSHAGDERNRAGLHLLWSCNNNDSRLEFKIKREKYFQI